jgi:hypothetical protein
MLEELLDRFVFLLVRLLLPLFNLSHVLDGDPPVLSYLPKGLSQGFDALGLAVEELLQNLRLEQGEKSIPALEEV